MKKILAVMLLISFLVLPVTVSLYDAGSAILATTNIALADDPDPDPEPEPEPAAAAAVTDPGDGPPENLDVITVLAGLVNWMFYILMMVAALFLVFAGFTYLTASGDPDKVKKAHDSVLWALVGVAVAVMARGLVSLVEKILGQG